MQTFLPESTFKKCAQVLDNLSLNKQLLEGRQIMKLLVDANPKAAWFNHPAVRMWNGYVPALYIYLRCVKRECNVRGTERLI